MGPTWDPPESCGPQVGPCWPHELCYQGSDGSTLWYVLEIKWWLPIIDAELASDFLHKLCPKLENVIFTYENVMPLKLILQSWPFVINPLRRVHWPLNTEYAFSIEEEPYIVITQRFSKILNSVHPVAEELGRGIGTLHKKTPHSSPISARCGASFVN